MASDETRLASPPPRSPLQTELGSTEMHGTSRIVIRAGKLEEFKRLAAQCVEIVRTQDTGTLEYNHFLNADGTECFVHERYRDSAAGLEHMVNIAPMMQPLSEICTITGEVCGSPSPELRESLVAAGVTLYEPFMTLAP
jgi:quinol monooxygenase YgiN